MIGIVLSIFFAGFMIADAIMFVNGYRGYLFRASTKQEKSVRQAYFESKNIEWSGKD